MAIRRVRTNREALRKATALAGRIGHAFVATASAERLLHVAVAGKLALGLDGRVVVTK